MKTRNFIVIGILVSVIGIAIIRSFPYLLKIDNIFIKEMIALILSAVLSVIMIQINDGESKYYKNMAVVISDEFKKIFNFDYFKTVTLTRDEMEHRINSDSFMSIKCKKITIIGETGDTLYTRRDELEIELEKKDIEMFIIDPDCPLAKDKNKAFENKLGKNDFIKKIYTVLEGFNSFVDRVNVKNNGNHYFKVYTYKTDPCFSAIIIENGNKHNEYYISPRIYARQPTDCPCIHIVEKNKLYAIYHEAIKEFLNTNRNDNNLFIANIPFKQTRFEKKMALLDTIKE